MHNTKYSHIDLPALANDIKSWGVTLGFQQLGITNINLEEAELRLLNWLNKRYHGEMDYMHRHGTKRSRPAELVPGTLRIISARMNYWRDSEEQCDSILSNSHLGYVSRYALGRDYHKLLRKRLQQLGQRIENTIGQFGYRVFTDSAPVLEKALAENAGLGWIGKHSNLIEEQTGSWFFIGEIYTDLPLPVDTPAKNHCGTCQSCITACPTGAIVAPYTVDARLCISYLTIELRGSIPVELRALMGNRIYGCDDCQLVCPWNRFTRTTQEQDFFARNKLDSPALIDLFSWTEQEFLTRTEGSAIRRIGYPCWLRNIAVALGNATPAEVIVTALQSRSNDASELVREHVQWALQQQEKHRTPRDDPANLNLH
ncbi:MAG: tRNA epoxyqueuosine(34) reductase QueG [Gammaproteobacteria bacterium]|nr:tRNA epoxyqueuosine(34) reductase QueG [Gammaproteobacteria bacterium]